MIMAKLRGLVVMVVILGLASLFGWSTGTIDKVIVLMFGIGLIFFIASVFRRL